MPLMVAGDEAQTVRPTDFEWNWLNGKTGQLDGRDRVVHNLGSVLAATLKVPS